MNSATTAASLKGKWAHRTKMCPTRNNTIYNFSYSDTPIFIVDVVSDGIYFTMKKGNVGFLNSDWLDSSWREWPQQLPTPKGYKKEETMKKLVVGVRRVNNIVFGKVLKMDEGLREINLLAVGGKIIDHIGSIQYPALGGEVILVRGSLHAKDNDWFSYHYDTIGKAEQVVEDIKMLVAKVNSGDQTEELVGDCGLEIIS